HMVQYSGDHAYKMGDYEKAAAEYREVITRQPDNWQTRIDLARAYLAGGRADAAREQMEVVYTIKPNEHGVLDLLAETMIESADVEAMAGELRRQGEERQTVSDWLRFGAFMHKANDNDESEQAFLTAARIDKGMNLGPQMALANLYRDLGDQPAALDRYRMALYIKPNDKKIQEQIRALGEIPGPSYALVPAERGDR
ncbi:MAG: tetratricopeptide repeat protein, partial [Fimbriimonadaceae bacterium]|nr:tetratricopeptide repeat protein [Fimbriimonadaceae bacterium]